MTLYNLYEGGQKRIMNETYTLTFTDYVI